MSQAANYSQSERAQSFLSRVESPKYERNNVNGISPFLADRVPDDMKGFYSEAELAELAALQGTDRDVESRMPVKMTRHYFEMARTSPPLRRLVKASPDETKSLAGSEDPGHQMDYSPVEGLLHKYELGLLYVTSTCSAHCRFCYREELIARKEVERQDGTVAKKGLAKIDEVANYVLLHNRLVASNGGVHPETGREKLREILLSGGDPMVLPNRKLAEWLSAMGDVGIESIRIGTKEMAFFPDRFDASFIDMLKDFRQNYPEVGLHIMVHFNHPDEFLVKDPDGNYLENANGSLKWNDSANRAMERIHSLGWVTVENQAPIIRGINDDPDALRIMQRAMKRIGAENHYFFCGRDIVAHEAFNVPIETAWHILNESQKGLSGVETRARLSITHYKGKTEVAAVTHEPLQGIPGTENGFLVFKLLRNAADAPDRGKVCIVGRNPDAIWFDGYNDRVIFDEAGLFEYERVEAARIKAEAAAKTAP